MYGLGVWITIQEWPIWVPQWVYLGHAVGLSGHTVRPPLASGGGSTLIPTVEPTVDGSLRPHLYQHLLLPEQLSL